MLTIVGERIRTAGSGSSHPASESGNCSILKTNGNVRVVLY